VTFITDSDDEAVADPAEAGGSDDDPFGTPWYRRPGAIVGWVAGGLAVIALAADGGSDDSAVSPFTIED